MKNFNIAPLVGILAFASIAGAQPPPKSDQAPRFEESLVVTAMPRPSSGSEYFLTFSGPVAVPGVTLPAGTYVFRFPVQGAKAIQVLKADRSDAYALFHTIPIVDENRSLSSDAHEVMWAERRADATPAIKAWFLPGQATGFEFVYPTAAPLKADQALRFKESVVVVTAAPKAQSTSEYFLTVSGPVAVPGVLLAAGTYLFRFPVQGAKVIQVLKADRSNAYALFHAIPITDASRSLASDAHEVRWAERRADAPPAIKAWFFPGQTTGYEFIYPNR